MIDTDKYEKHVLVDGVWIKHIMSQEEYDATKALIADAPLLLEEVKQLRTAEQRRRMLEASGPVTAKQMRKVVNTLSHERCSLPVGSSRIENANYEIAIAMCDDLRKRLEEVNE